MLRQRLQNPVCVLGDLHHPKVLRGLSFHAMRRLASGWKKTGKTVLVFERTP
jgi:hypothetical protein